MTRKELGYCEEGTFFISNDNVFLVLEKDRWMLKLVQMEYEIEDDIDSAFFLQVSEFEMELDEYHYRSYDEGDYTFEIELFPHGKPFYQHYKDIEDPDFDVPYEDTYYHKK